MKPTPIEWLIASRYTLPIWLGLAGYLYYSQGGSWENFSDDQRIGFMVLGGIFALAYLKSFVTVFFYEREQSLYRKAHISPEERWRRATVFQTFFLVLLAAGLIYFGFSWWSSSEPEPQKTTSYKAASIGLGGFGILASTAYYKVRTWKSSKPQGEQVFYVRCCFPVPQASTQTMELPDYAHSLLANAKQRSPASDEHLRFADARTQYSQS
ncbi:MAG: hypothetical protein E6Q61_05440 [Nitrosomonas sp.]|nr:MAG: hypothetical protein E6Q61_05440 [Nitrosomonas sp.]